MTVSEEKSLFYLILELEHFENFFSLPKISTFRSLGTTFSTCFRTSEDFREMTIGETVVELATYGIRQ